jgi:Na+/glutamate symporter
MSGHGFHVHGPHDHELEHATHGGGHGHDEASSSMTNQIAMFTAIIATVGAIFGYMGGATQANAGLYKNNAAIKKTEASNQWNYYQAKSSKQNLSELALELAPATKKEFYENEIKRYKGEKADIKKDAEKLEAEAKAWDERSDSEIHLHHRWAQATTALQVSIALAAIALLTRKEWLKKAMYVVGALGVVVGGLAVMHI